MKLFIFILFCALNVFAKTQISLLGLTYHIPAPPKENVQYMTNRIDGDGVFAYNPQINIMNIDDENKIIHGAILIDCYGHGAGFLAFGKRYKITNAFYYGFELGAYIRQIPHEKDTGRRFLPEIGIYQIMPSPAFVAQYQFAPNFYFRLQSNILLNLFDIAMEF